MRGMAVVSGLFGISLLGCAAAPPTPPRSTASLARPSPKPAQRHAPPPQLDRPASDAEEWVPSAAYPIFITKSELLVGTPARSVLLLPPAEERGLSGVGAPNKDSANGGYIVPLAQAMAARACEADGKVQPIAVVHVDRDMQYRVLVEALYTLSDLGYKELFIATRTLTGSDGSPAWRGVRVRAVRNAEFQVVARRDGYWLTTQELVEFGRDCRALSPQPAPGTPSAALSLSDVQHCVDLLSGEEGALHLAPEGDLPIRAVLPLLQAFGSKRPVTPAFPISGPVAGAPARSLPQGATFVAPHVGNASHVIEGLREPFRACYRGELTTSDNAGGTIKLTLRVGANGTVSDASIEVRGSLQTTAECVRSVARTAVFQPPEGGSAVIEVPLTFVKDRHITQKLPCVGAPRTN